MSAGTARATVVSAAEARTIEMIASGVALTGVLDELCRTVDALVPGVVSTVLVMDPDGMRLWPGGAPGFPDVLKPAINPWWIGPGRGSCGTAAFLKERVIIGDVTTDARFPEEYRTLAVRHGLRASWSQPLLASGGAVLGTFAMYYAEPRVPEPADLELIDALGRVALAPIQLERSQAALRDGATTLATLGQRLSEVREDKRTVAERQHTDLTERLGVLSTRLERLRHAPAGTGRLGEEIAGVSEQIAELARDIQLFSHRV